MSEPQIIPTVYSFVFPEVKTIFDRLRTQENLGEMYERAWTKRQDPMHFELMETWQKWTASALDVNWQDYPHSYACTGSSEAIRASIAVHTAAQRAAGQAPRIHVFEGEYEGYRAYAGAFFCEVVTHRRQDYKESLKRLAQSGERIYLSAPSSIDGNAWTEVNEFIHFVDAELEGVRLAIDLCYVGCTRESAAPIDLNAECIDTVFFSLSKVFGVYYHRIGGVFTREPMPALVGNRWFKNLFSIKYGVELMKAHPLGELPATYAKMQSAIVSDAGIKDLKVSDVVLLAHVTGPAQKDDPYYRTPMLRRYCLTPELDARANA